MNQISLILCALLICIGFANKTSNENSLIKFSHIEAASCMVNCLQCLKGPNSCTKCTEGADCCNWACSKCENQITCKDCMQGFRLDENLNVCVSEYSCEVFCEKCDENQICEQCFDGYFLNKEMLICQKCAPKCFKCESLDNCYLCNPKTYLKNGLCLDCQQNCLVCKNETSCNNCEQSYYIDPVGKCQKCMDYCGKCTSGNNCQSCSQKFYYNADENKCAPCSNRCSKCLSQNQCLSCEFGYYYNKSLKICQSCDEIYPHCIDCFNPTSLQTINATSDIICMKCDQRYYVSNNQCENCSQHCTQCQTKNSCISCLQKYFVNDSGLCQECKILFCLFCERKDVCLICQTGFYWNGDVSKLRCLKCPYGCKQCDQYSCRSCVNGLYLKNGNCYRCAAGCFSCNSQLQECSICMPGYFKVEFLVGQCTKCAQPCMQCDSITNCTKCIYGFYLDNGVCKKCEIQGCDQCKFTQEISNTIGNSNQTLQLQYKSSTRACIRCSTGYLLVNSTCKKCIDWCQRCYNLDTCAQCHRGYSLNKQGTKCMKCPQHTMSCMVNPYNQQQIIIYDCQIGYARDAKLNKCVLCIKNCRFCLQVNPSSYCLDCLEGYYHFYHTNNSSQQCVPCKSPCKTCSSQTVCLSCVTGYYMNEKDLCIKCGQGCEQCLSDVCFVCKEGYRLDVVSLKCDKCKVESCLYCKSSLEKCDMCDHGYVYYVPTTNVSTYLQADEQQLPLCYRCDQQIQGCKSCQSPLLCTQCFSGLELVDSGDNDVKNTCVLSTQWQNQGLYFIIIGVLSLVCLILIICIIVTRRKLSKTLNNKIVKPNENQTLIQTSQQSISPIDTVISSSPSYGKKSSVFNSFTGIN